MKTIGSLALTFSLLLLAAPGWAQSSLEQPSDPQGAEDTSGLAEPESALAEPAAAPGEAISAPQSAAQQALVVEGAPLGNANVHVHIVEKKPYTNAGRHELVLYPATTQINAKFTRHVGVAATYAYHLFENLALQVTPIFNYYNRESGFNGELITKGGQQAQAATALLLQYGAVAGVEMTPIYGKFAFYDGVLGHFTFVLSAGAGMGMTRVQLSSDDEDAGALFGDTGAKFVGSVSAGLRVFLGERAALRFEVRDLVYTARVDSINGCNLQDLNELKGGRSPGSAGCRAEEFRDQPIKTSRAQTMVQETSSDVLNNISLFWGFSFLF